MQVVLLSEATGKLVSRLLSGDRRALARAISLVENNSSDVAGIMSRIYPECGHAHVVGFTGPPGAGKSTLVDRVTRHLRLMDHTVGIIAVDPTSPFTGGAILGDRIRMNEIALDPGVFIRSMGTRGHLGGLARATGEAIRLMDAFGKDYVLVETVGAGQSEVDIVKSAHTTVIVEMPGLGDDVQAIKAGILEIGDLFVVNKADRDGIDKSLAELDAMLDLRGWEEEEWKPPILPVTARENRGVDAVVDVIRAHREHLRSSGSWERLIRERLTADLRQLVRDGLYHRIVEGKLSERALGMEARVAAGEIDPYSASAELLGELDGQG